MDCLKCRKRTCLKTGRPCRAIENLLERENARHGYSLRHIRRKEIPYSPEGIDLATIEASQDTHGRQRDTKPDTETL